MNNNIIQNANPYNGRGSIQWALCGARISPYTQGVTMACTHIYHEMVFRRRKQCLRAIDEIQGRRGHGMVIRGIKAAVFAEEA